ncbi:MAG: UDP-N-acetylglucosamine 1-carboxyvinyltransferase [Candidatus Zixiibacteriota bacterium]|nr:MAG: UDP-N-acetylglucosamine 1-carboxyvinyltransferase [candidate division Zixibacteria bacterium]
MDKYIINGNNRLEGSVRADGSKNAALPIIVATLLIDNGTSVIHNVPHLRDIETVIKVLKYLGAVVDYDQENETLTVNAQNITENKAPYDLMRQMRASFLVLGPLLARVGEARVSLPGGCSIGARPVDYHIKAFASMGAEIIEESGYVIARAKQLVGGSIYFDRPSHTGTENVIFGAVLAKKPTYITNAACDPEIIDVANFLNLAGAKIRGAGTPTIIIEPVEKLKPVEYSVFGDRLIAGTYLFAAAITGGDVEVTGIDPDTLTMVSHKLREMGCTINESKSAISIRAPQKLKPVNAATFPYPGFPTDLQACLLAATTIASGTSYITETVFIDRFVHTMEMRRLGANINVAEGKAVIQGVEKLTGAEIMAPDIRAGAGLVVACLAAVGKSEILRIYHIDRGYYKLEDKLKSLGADINRIEAD